MAITKSDLEFMEEAKKAFMENEELSTYRDENGCYIALRTSSTRCRDSITVLNTVFVEEFEGFLPEGKPLGIIDYQEEIDGEVCEYCTGKDGLKRKELMYTQTSDYKVFINSCNYLEDNVIGGTVPHSVYGIKINFCPMCGRDLNKF